MALMISTSANYHWVKKITASTNGGGVLKLTLRGASDANSCQFNEVEINVFTDNVEMTSRLIEAINSVSKVEAAPEIVCEKCDRCDGLMHPGAVEDAYGEFVCSSCDANAAEAAYERHCEDFHDGGCTRFNSIRDQQIEAQKLK